MTEIKIGKGEEPSEYTNHVLVRATRSGTYQVSAVSNLNGVPERFTSPHFNTMHEAMSIAMDWAKRCNIADIHVYSLDRS